MKNAEERLIEARQAERHARAQWFRSLDIAQERLAPNAIARTAIEQVKEGASDAVGKATAAARSRPGTMVAIGAALGLFLFRKPITSALRTRLSRKSEIEATDDPFHSLPQQSEIERLTETGQAPITIISEEV